MTNTIQLEQFPFETIQTFPEDDVSVPAKTFLGIAYTAVSGKPTTLMLNHFMLDNEKSFEDLISTCL